MDLLKAKGWTDGVTATGPGGAGPRRRLCSRLRRDWPSGTLPAGRVSPYGRGPTCPAPELPDAPRAKRGLARIRASEFVPVPLSGPEKSWSCAAHRAAASDRLARAPWLACSLLRNGCSIRAVCNSADERPHEHYRHFIVLSLPRRVLHHSPACAVRAFARSRVVQRQFAGLGYGDGVPRTPLSFRAYQ